jgi:hypothetical protein
LVREIWRGTVFAVQQLCYGSPQQAAARFRKAAPADEYSQGVSDA